MATKNDNQQPKGFIQIGGSSGSTQAPKPAQGYPSTKTAPTAPPVKRCGSCGKW